MVDLALDPYGSQLFLLQVRDKVIFRFRSFSISLISYLWLITRNRFVFFFFCSKPAEVFSKFVWKISQKNSRTFVLCESLSTRYQLNISNELFLNFSLKSAFVRVSSFVRRVGEIKHGLLRCLPSSTIETNDRKKYFKCCGIHRKGGSQSVVKPVFENLSFFFSC